MQLLASKQDGLQLNESFQTYAHIDVDPFFIIYHQFLLQLHLPCEKWGYVKHDPSQIRIQIPEQIEQMDVLTLNYSEVKQFVYPSRLFTYYLLCTYFAMPNEFGGVGLFHKRKTHFVFLSSTQEIKDFGRGKFEMDAIGRYALKNLKKGDLQTAFESFFVLIDEKLEPKLQLALTQYVSSTGNQIDKSFWLDRALNMERIKALQEFIRPFIY